MPKTTLKPRRIVHSSQVVEDAISKEDFAKPETPTPTRTLSLTYEQRIQRQIEMASLALNKYEKKLRAGIDLNIDEERLMISQQDSLRKLESTLQTMNAKVSLDDKSDLDLALSLMDDKGLDYETVCRLFKHNPELADQLKEALDGRAE